MNNLQRIEKQKQYELNELIHEINTFKNQEYSGTLKEHAYNHLEKEILWEKYEQLIWKEQELITIERMRDHNQ